MSDARASRESFLAAHVEPVYDRLTERGSTFRRIDDLVYAAANLVPGLVPTQKEVRAEAAHRQGDKDGVEIDQGLFLAHALSRPRIGAHLCHAMLLPRPEIGALAAEFAARGSLDLGAARLTRRGKAVHLDMINPRFLNAEDDTTLAETELAVDVATLDRTTEIAVMRGVAVDNEKYRGKRIFGAGINLTHLYLGKIPYLWFLIRDLGYVHKILRGVASPESVPDDVNGRGVEKLWIAAVDTFAIGGHCQALLCMDYVLAASDAFLTLPARKEGIIPGFANLRLPRFVGDRIARQAILYERRLKCDSAEGRLICDEIAPAARDGRGSRPHRRGPHQRRRRQRHRQSSRLPGWPGAARSIPTLRLGLRARAGLLSLQPGADRQSRAQLGREEQKDLRRAERRSAVALDDPRRGLRDDPTNDALLGGDMSSLTAPGAIRARLSAVRRSCAAPALVLALVLGIAAPAFAEDKEVDLRLSLWVPPAHPLTGAAKAWGGGYREGLERHDQDHGLSAEQLGKAFDHYDMARDDIADITYVNPGYQPGRFPIIAIGQMPFMFGDARKGTAALNSWYRKYAATEMKDTHFCFAFIHDPGALHSRKKIVLPQDLTRRESAPGAGR